MALTVAGCASAPSSPAAPAEPSPRAAEFGTGLVVEHLTPSADAMAAVTAAPPAAVDLTQWAPPAGDQGQVGSCVAWSLDYTALGWYQRHDKIGGGALAPMYTYAQLAKGHDTGSSFTGNLNIATSQGVDTQADYTQGNFDYTSQPTAAERANAAHWKLSSYTVLPVDRIAIETSLAAGHPVLIGMAVYNNFFSVGTANHGFYSGSSGSFAGYHAITALGYDATGLRIENSWSRNWGDNGFATLSWAFVTGGGVFSAIDVSGFAPGAPVMAAPTVTKLSSTAGPLAGGATLTVTGTGFTGVTGVTVGGVAATNVVANASGTSLTLTLPAHAAGAALVKVTTAAGSNGSSAAATYTYVAAPTVSAVSTRIGVTTGGTKVTITGTNLTDSYVTFGSTRVTGTVTGGTSLVVGAPAGTTPAALTVVGVGGSVSAGTFTWSTPPKLTALSVTSGPAAGGTRVTVTGSALKVGTTTVSIGSKTVSPTSIASDGSSLQFTVPAGTKGRASLTVKTDLGSSNALTWTWV